jgi:hypothetical protein
MRHYGEGATIGPLDLVKQKKICNARYGNVPWNLNNNTTGVGEFSAAINL